MRGATRSTRHTIYHLRFQSTPLMRGATWGERGRFSGCEVSIHAPHARGDLPRQWSLPYHQRFNPRPSCEGRRRSRASLGHGCGFNPRPSCEGRPVFCPVVKPLVWFQSTPLMRGATFGTRHVILFQQVSIHAPHARGDQSARTSTWPRTCFNPRPSCEGRPNGNTAIYYGNMFQSTPLMRGATYPQDHC